MELKNYTEIIVEQVLNDIISSKQAEICTCARCKLDIMAMALNNLPTHYFVNQTGEVYSKIAASYTEFRTRVVTELTKAIMQVRNEPQH